MTTRRSFLALSAAGAAGLIFGSATQVRATAVFPDPLPEQYRGWKRWFDPFPPRFNYLGGRYVLVSCADLPAYQAAEFESTFLIAPNLRDGVTILFVRR